MRDRGRAHTPDNRLHIDEVERRLLTGSIRQNGELLVGRPGDVVFVPKGANYSSLKNPFKAFL